MTLDQHGRESLHPRDQLLRSGHGRSWNKNYVVNFPKYRVRLLYRGDLSEVNPLDSEWHSIFQRSAKKTRKKRQRRFKQNHKALTLVGSRTLLYAKFQSRYPVLSGVPKFSFFGLSVSRLEVCLVRSFREVLISQSTSAASRPEGHHRVLL